MTFEPRLFILLPATCCFLSFCWAMLRHFRSVGPMPHGMRLVGALSILIMGVFAWQVSAMPLSAAWPAALALMIGSLALFGWTVRTTRNADFALAFAGVQPRGILVTGPFRYVRHPFYTSYIIFWLAICIATTSSLCWLGSIVLLVCYVVAARQEERNISLGRFAAEYGHYASRTGMFLPRLIERH